MAANHETVVALVQIALSKIGARLFKNQMGEGFYAKGVAQITENVIQIYKPSRVSFGIAKPGGSDLIGWTKKRITASMIGQDVAVFTAVECKTPQYMHCSPEQKNFLAQVKKSGGIALVARRDGDGVAFEELQ